MKQAHLSMAMATAVMLTSASFAHAAVIHVPGDYPTIQEAINAALPYGDEIIVAPGEYGESLNFKRKEVYLHSSDGYEATVIKAPVANRPVILCISGEGPATIIEGMTITGGNVSGSGGAVYQYGSWLTLIDCSITDNRATESGGAIYSEYSTLTMVDCLVKNNVAVQPDEEKPRSGYGGAIDAYNSHVMLVDSTFTRNVSDWRGGAIRYSNEDVPLVLVGCTFDDNIIRNPLVPGYSWHTSGAAVHSYGFTEVHGCTFRHNRIMDNPNSNDGTGCALYVGSYMRQGGAVITDSTFIENAFVGKGSGGGVYCEDVHTTIEGCRFLRQDAGRGSGAAVCTDFSNLTLTDCLFAENFASSGGALYHWGTTLICDSCVFADNTGNYHGGAVQLYFGDDATFTDCRFIGNLAGTEGGAIDRSSVDALWIRSCEFQENSASIGGAVHGSITTYNPIDIRDCIFNGNHATFGGAVAVWAYWPDSTSGIANSIFTQNHAAYGGAVYFEESGRLVLSQCLLQGNVASVDGNTAAGAGAIELANSILLDDPVELNTADKSVSYCVANDLFDGAGNIVADPLFVDPNSGNFHLRSGSPCIDAGNNDLVPPDVLTDADGNPRFVDDTGKPDRGVGADGVVDIGPYEFQNTSTNVLTVSQLPLVQAETARIIITNAVPNEKTWLLYSTRGLGSTYIPQLNVTVDLSSPKRATSPTMTTSQGRAQFDLDMPTIGSEPAVWFQAVQQSNKTNYVGTRLVK